MDPTLRFSSRVSDYVKYRPGYPSAVIDQLAIAGILNTIFDRHQEDEVAFGYETRVDFGRLM